MTVTDVQSGYAPLIFVRPVGFAAADALRLVQAAQRMGQGIRWRLALQGVQADIYLAHRQSVVPSNAGPRPSRSESSGNSTFDAHGHSHLQLDAEGLHRGRPVCLLGPAAMPGASLADDADSYAPLAFPQALEDLRTGLEHAAQQLVDLRLLYQLGLAAWENRERWRGSRLQLSVKARLVAVIEPMHWRVHLQNDCSLQELEDANIATVPGTSAFQAPGFAMLPLETALWELAKRCPEPLLFEVLPTAFLRERLTHRRSSALSERALGDHCVAILRALDTHSRTADQLQTSLRLSRPALLRALACLALTRAIRPETAPRGLMRWLPAGLRRRLFGPTLW